MRKKIKWTIIIVLGIIIIAVISFSVLKIQTKTYSPEETLVFNQADLAVEVFYNRPYKKDREIFGELVPYGEVWRTGANEATTFETNKDILVDGSLLKAGKYTLWTIPGEKSWKVIFNTKMYSWGVDFDENALRNPKYDALVLELPVRKNLKPIEQFTIYFDKQENLNFMFLAWNKTIIAVPFRKNM